MIKKLTRIFRRGFPAAALLLAVMTAAFTDAAHAQDYSKEFGFSAGFSPVSTYGIGTTDGQQFVQVGLDFGFVLHRRQNVYLKYKVSLIPVAVVHGDQETHKLRPSRTVYGGGADPIGMQVNFRRHRRLEPFFAVTGGFLYFTEQVPVTDSSRFNFTFSGGGGGEYGVGRHSILFGYRYHHISNKNTGYENPGIDSHILFMGISYKR